MTCRAGWLRGTAAESAAVGELAAAIQAAGHVNDRKPSPSHPKGWEPGVTLDASGLGSGTVMLAPDQPLEGVEQLLRAMLPDVTDLSVLKVTQVRAWDSGNQICRYVRCDVQAAPVQVPDADLDALISKASKARNVTSRAPVTGDPFVVCLADWQAGKADGDGIDGLVQRIVNLEHDLADAVKRDRPPVVYLVGMGDLVEGCDGNYGTQTFSVQLDRRSQVRAARRLMWRLVHRLSRLVDRVVVATVPGNHGEHRRDGQQFTGPGDNDDVALVEQLAEVAAANPERYGNVSWIVPDQDLTVTLQIGETFVGFAHGHQAKGAGTPQQKIVRWWKDCGHHGHPVGDADLLVTGHYHHLAVVEDGRRTWMQCPALDGGSRYWEESGGGFANPGTLTFRVGQDGWYGLRVLR